LALFFVDPASVIAPEGLTDKHGNDPKKLGLSFHRTIDAVLCDQNVQACGTLQGRSTRNIEKATTICIGKLSVSFCEIQRDRC
jgi:hypothetical protein